MERLWKCHCCVRHWGPRHTSRKRRRPSLPNFGFPTTNTVPPTCACPDSRNFPHLSRFAVCLVYSERSDSATPPTRDMPGSAARKKVLQDLRRWHGCLLPSICPGQRTLRHQDYRSVSQHRWGTLWLLGRHTIGADPQYLRFVREVQVMCLWNRPMKSRWRIDMRWHRARKRNNTKRTE